MRQIENIRFYKAAVAFKQLPPECENLRSEASLIIVAHIKAGSCNEVNIPGEMRERILRDYESVVDSHVLLDIFKAAEEEIFTFMSQDSFPRFKAKHQHDHNYLELFASSEVDVKK